MTTIFRRTIAVSTLVLTLLPFAFSDQLKEAKPESRFAKLDAIRVHYQNYGKGKDALVFVHGWTCNLSHWKESAPVFSPHTRVIAIDLPGHGESDKPEKIDYSIDLFARAIDAVLVDAEVERATLVGHSMGTPVIRQFYRKYPTKTRALVIVDGSLKPFGTRESMEPMLANLRGPDYKKFAETFVNFLAQTMKDKKKLEEVRSGMLATPQYVMVGAMEGMLNPDIWKQDKITVPTLALMAPNPAWNAEYEKFARELAPGIDYQVFPGVSHFLMMDEPQKFNDAVMAFLKKNKLI